MRRDPTIPQSTPDVVAPVGRFLRYGCLGMVAAWIMYQLASETDGLRAATLQGAKNTPRAATTPVVRSARRASVSFREPPKGESNGEPVPFISPRDTRPSDAAMPSSPRSEAVPFMLAPPDARPLDEAIPSASQDEYYDYDRPIGSVSVNIEPSAGDLPRNYAAERMAQVDPIVQHSPAMSSAPQITYAWIAPGLCHRPLYFEEINLERHGYSWGVLQPAASALHFGVNLGLLPYKMVVYPRRECIYTLGHYRPGSYAPFQRQRLPVRLDAAAVEAGVIAGLILLIP
jgi:hypothetical protein